MKIVTGRHWMTEPDLLERDKHIVELTTRFSVRYIYLLIEVLISYARERFWAPGPRRAGG